MTIVQDSDGQTLRYAYGILIRVGDKLRPREIDVLKHVVQGIGVDESAEILGICPRTIDTYRGRAMARLGGKTMPHAVAIAFRTGVLPIEEGD